MELNKDLLKDSVWLDTETTGLSPGYAEVLQISLIDYHGNVLMNEYIKPKRATSWPDAEAVNGISPDMVKDCQTIDHFLPEMQKLFDRAHLIGGYNTWFDLRFLMAAGLRPHDQTVVDVMKEFAKIYGEWNDHFEDYKWQKLSVCADYYGYQFHAHNSLEDIKATLFCYKKMMKIQ